VSTEERGAYLSILAMAGVILVLLLLHIVLMREQVRKALLRKGFMPLQIRWGPYVYWGKPYCTAFRVLYEDSLGSQHRIRCCVYKLNFRVYWIPDEAGYLLKDIPLSGRLVYLSLLGILLCFGLRCLWANELVLPGTLKHPAPLHLHGGTLKLLAGAALCGAANLFTVLLFQYIAIGKEGTFTLIARGFSIIGWWLLISSLAVDTYQGLAGLSQ
jgi:hypothetical protein